MSRVLDLHAEKSELASGARCLAIAMPGRKRSMLSLDYRTGSRFESPEENGISHFLEHMLFRGTPRHPDSQSLAAAFEDLGGTLEASTAADRGNLSICLPRVNLEPAIDLVAEVFTEPLLSGVEVERSIIFEEIQEDFDDRGQLIDGASVLRRLAFGSGGLGQLITGPAENLEKFETPLLRSHQQKTHVGSALVATVSGDVDPNAILDLLGRRLSNVAPGEGLLTAEPLAQDAPRFSFIDHSGSSQTAVHLGFRGPGQDSPWDPALEMLLRVIDDGMSTRVYQRLCDRSGLCYDAGATMEVYSDVGLIEFEATTSHQTCLRVVQELLDLTQELREQPLPAGELDRARRRVQWEYEALSDSVVEVAEVFAHAEFTGTAGPERRLGDLLGVTAVQMQQAAQHVLCPENRSLVAIGSASPRQRARLEELAFQSR